ncbi:four helix bundle protein [Aquimarina pacifica]|uniref:four helix bundle protein n=1 Tax=Aquimarina pacifica TaxID=1296415 RepID=UPI00047298FC|nr:four helix bundle protein [Aquimarina pacifica]
MHKVEDLTIWRMSIDLAKLVYQLTSALPSNEKYGLISQINRSAISISSNIAEGAGRNSNKEFKHFLSIANGSAYELQTLLILTIELNLLTEEKVKPSIQFVTEIQKMNYSLQRSIEKKISVPNTKI